MSTLLRKLEEGGTVEVRGGFSIDPEKAREKLRQYQLADPHRYVLLLVEAAVIAGAERLDFEVDADDMHLRFVGEAYSYAQLQNIYGSLFIDASEASAEELEQLRGIQQLAFAVNAAMALNPRWIRVRSVGADGRGAVLELRPEQPDELELIEGGEPGTHVHVKDRFRPGLVLEFFRSIGGKLAEVELLREHCKWSTTAVELNGERISGELEFEGDYWWAEDVVEDERVIGRAALGLVVPESDDRLLPAWVSLLSNGVFVEAVELEGAAPGFGAIVDSAHLRRDVSQSSLLRDAGFRRTLDSARAANDRLVARLAQRWARGEGGVQPWAPACLREWLLRRDWGEGERGRLARALRDNPYFAAVADVPLWRAVGGGHLSTRELIEGERPIRFAAANFEFVPVDVPFVVLRFSDWERRLLEHLFAGELFDYTETLQRERLRQRLRLAFMARTHLPQLPEGHFVIRETIRGEVPARRVDGKFRPARSIHGELGVRPFGRNDSAVRLLTEGAMLCEVELGGPIPGLLAVVACELDPNRDYDGARPDDALALSLLAVLEALERACARLAQLGPAALARVELRELLGRYLRAVCRREFEVDFLEAFGFNGKDARRKLRKFGGPATRPSWGFRLGEADPPKHDDHPLTRVPLFRAVDGSLVSLAELRRRLAEGERVTWLDGGLENIGELAAVPELNREVLLIEGEDREVLRHLLGAEALVPFAEELAWLRRRAEFLAKAEVPRRLDHAVLVSSAMHRDGLRGELGLRDFSFSQVGEGATPVQVFYRGRELCELELELPLPGLTAWVDGSTLEIDRQFRGLAQPKQLRAPLLAELVDLVELELGRAAARPEELRRSEWWFLAFVPRLVFGDDSLTRAFVAVREAFDLDRAFVELDALLELVAEQGARAVERVVGRLLNREAVPTCERVREGIGQPRARVSADERAHAELRRALLPATRGCIELGSYRRFEGGEPSTQRPLSLAALMDIHAAGEPIAWVSESFSLSTPPEHGRLVVVVDLVEQSLLEGLFGARALESVADWLRGRSRFEGRRKIDEIRVPRGSTFALLEVQAQIQGQRVRGELAIDRASPRSVARSRVRVFTEGRELCTLDFPARRFALVGALEIDELEVNEAHTGVGDRQRRAIHDLLRSYEGKLQRELAARYAELSKADRRRAAEIVRHMLANWPPGNGRYAARARKAPKTFAQLAALPVFPGARKPWSAVELADAGDSPGIYTLEFRRDVELPDAPVVVLESSDVGQTLERLFGRTRSLDAELDRRERVAARKQGMAPLRAKPPAGALVTTELTACGLEGWLAITGQDFIEIGAEGRAVGKRSVALFPCAGAVWGVRINDDWSGYTLTREEDSALRRAARDLWAALADEFEASSGADAPQDRGGRRRLAELRRRLHGQFLRLHEECGVAYRRSSKKKKRKPPKNATYGFYERLRGLALLELGNGHWISAETAARERPIELAELELWEGPSAEEIAHRRAVERREAERRREAELEARRERERARRREAQAAREREAKQAREAEKKREAKRRAEQEREAERRAEQEAEGERDDRGDEAEAQLEGPSQDELLLEALREELRMVRSDRKGLVSNRHLDALGLAPPSRRLRDLFEHDDGKILLNPEHALVVGVRAHYLDDPAWLTLLASATYSFLNIIYREIEDEDEAAFIALHAGYAATAFAEHEPG